MQKLNRSTLIDLLLALGIFLQGANGTSDRVLLWLDRLSPPREARIYLASSSSELATRTRPAAIAVSILCA